MASATAANGNGHVQSTNDGRLPNGCKRWHASTTIIATTVDVHDESSRDGSVPVRGVPAVNDVVVTVIAVNDDGQLATIDDGTGKQRQFQLNTKPIANDASGTATGQFIHILNVQSECQTVSAQLWSE